MSEELGKFDQKLERGKTEVVGDADSEWSLIAPPARVKWHLKSLLVKWHAFNLLISTEINVVLIIVLR